MIRTILCGYGQMGKQLHETICHCSDMEMVMIVDRLNEQDLYRLDQPPDLLIDFSHPAMFDMVLRYVQYSGCALLSGTTNLSAYQYQCMRQLGCETRIMYAQNYSVGITIMVQLVKQMTPFLEADFDMEIMEIHHAQKQDAPSGTAQLLLEAMDPYHAYQEINGRCGMSGKRNKEIGVHAIRGGNVAGEHSVLYLGDDEKLEIKHTATSRKIFANGAIRAAHWLMKQEIGFYTMEHMVGGI